LYELKLSLGFLFGIINILSLWWGTSRFYFLKRKNEKKNVDCLVYTKKKSRDKKYIFLFFLKKMLFLMLKKDNVLFYYEEKMTPFIGEKYKVSSFISGVI